MADESISAMCACIALSRRVFLHGFYFEGDKSERGSIWLTTANTGNLSICIQVIYYWLFHC